MRLIDADALLKTYEGFVGYEEHIKIINEQPTINAIPIREGAVGGDIIEAMFHDLDITEIAANNKLWILLHGLSVDDFSLKVSKEWWFAQYNEPLQQEE